MIEHIDSRLASAWLHALAPPPVIAPSKFAEDELILQSSAAAIPGPLRLASYQREIIDAFADDEVEIIVLMLSSQVGKSLSVNAMVAYCMACVPGPMLHVSPKEKNCIAYVRESLDPLIAVSPRLRAIVGKGQNTRKGSTGGADSLSAKSVPGGQLNFASSYKPDELAARPIKYLWLDETDRMATSAGVEGCPVALAEKRTTTFKGKGRKVVIVSTPTNRGSRIFAWFNKGDQRRFFVECPDCNVAGPLSIDDLKFDHDKPESAYLSCPHCGAVHEEATKRAMVDKGKWQATAVGEKGVRSYHLNELSSRFSTLEAVARQKLAAKTPEQRQSFYNTCLAEIYEAGVEVSLTSSELEKRAEPIGSPYASDIQFVTAGVDVQGNRLECTLLAHHSDSTMSVLNHAQLAGDTSGDAVWRSLDALLGETFTLRNGVTLDIHATAVDAGFNTDQVHAFVRSQQRKSRRVYPVKGASGFAMPWLKNGARVRGQTQHLIVGVDAVKHGLQMRLAMDEIGPGYIRLPDHLPPAYFDGLASEELRVREVRGAPQHFYHRTVRKNEPLDCLVYAAAISKRVRIQALAAPKQQDTSNIAKLAAQLHAASNL